MSRKFRIRFAFVLATAALIAQSAFAQDEPQWKFTEIGGNRIAWSCEGVGEPTIVLIAGIVFGVRVKTLTLVNKLYLGSE